MLGGAARLAGVLGALREVARAPCVNGLLELRRHDLHGVLDRAAVLVETAFLSNSADRALLTDPARQADFAAAIAVAIVKMNS